MSRQRDIDRAGAAAFSLVEVVIAIAIMSVLLTASLTAIGHAARDRGVQSDIELGNALASSLLHEVMSRRFADPVGAPPAGGAGNRNLYRDVMDYDDFRETSPSTRAGDKIAGAEGWSWRVNARRVTLDETSGMLAAPTGNSRADAVLIVVEAMSPRGKVYRQRGYRTAWGMNDQPTPDGGVVESVWVRARVGGQTRTATVMAGNQPAP